MKNELHHDFVPAKWRGTTATDGKTIGVSFNATDGSIIRLALEVDSARKAAESILHYLEAQQSGTNSHSEKSSGSPSLEVSAQRE